MRGSSGGGATKAASGEEFVYAELDLHPSYRTAARVTGHGIHTADRSRQTRAGDVAFGALYRFSNVQAIERK